MTKIVVDPKTSQTRGTKQPFRCLDVWILWSLDNYHLQALGSPCTATWQNVQVPILHNASLVPLTDSHYRSGT